MDTTAALEASSSSSSSKHCNYDVFVSCRGEDTRKGFTDNLFCKLLDHKIRVFIGDDENELKRGKNITDDELEDTIKRSRIFVIVFSKRYADSIWCLDELVKIMECRKTLGKLVLPIFYDVHPSDVREQTGTFAEAFKRHEQRFHQVKDKEEKIESWREALTEAADLDHKVFKQTDGYEGMFIREVIVEIVRELESTYLDVAIHPVGMDRRLKEFSFYLNVGGSKDVCIIGIWGMGGLGKTEVAKAIFNKYHHSFDGKSFLQNVREKKLVDLQKQLLFDILKPANIEVRSVDEGTKEIEKRLGNIRVLVIIDDIDHVKLLDVLAIKRDTFGLGSRIIITTRDEHLLKILKVDKIYSVQAMNKEESLELFSWHAFGNCCPNEGYLELSRKAVDYCGGLPLALQVVGCSLFTKHRSVWVSTMDKLKRYPPVEIHEKLKISYDSLTDDDVKAVFLDISCFFIGMNKEHVMKILDGCDLYPEIGIGELHERCLVTVDKKGNLMMHDLNRDMGREVVRAESPDNPGNWSRLWDHKDVIGVLRNNTGTEEIEGLTLDLQESDESSFSTEAFRKMQSLRLLKLNYVKLNGSYKYLCEELRWLCWHGFPLEVIPEDFNPPNLVAIDLSYSKLKQVWKDSDVLLEKLKFLNLSHSHDLKDLPDFSNLPNLEQLILIDCTRLFTISPSIGQLERLVLVNLKDCKMLSYLPESFYKLKSIKTLVLAGCSSFEKVQKDLGEMVSLTTLVDDLALRIRPPFIVNLKNLKYLTLHGLSRSPSTNLLSRSLFQGPKYLREIGCPSLSDLSNLQKLSFKYCTYLPAIPDLPKNLVVLRAMCCPSLERVPDFSEMYNMRELYLSDSFMLAEIPGLDKSLKSMARIHMEGCTNLTADFRKNILQGWTSCGYGGIFLYGNDIPEWFQFVQEGDVINFDVPQSDGRHFKGLTLSAVYSSSKQPAGDHPLCITVTNKTKRTALSARITYASVPTSGEREDHYLWQGQLSNDVLSLQGGDQVRIFVRPVETVVDSVQVKKTGVNLVWDKFMKENTHDSHHLYDFNPHTDCFSGADDENRPFNKLRSYSIDDADDDHDNDDERTPEKKHMRKLREFQPNMNKDLKKVVGKMTMDDMTKEKAMMKAISQLDGVESIAADMKEQKLTEVGEKDAIAKVSRGGPYPKIVSKKIFLSADLKKK